jgi:Protein of unknown function
MSEDKDESEDSGLRWEDVSLPASVSVADLDALIFQDIVQNWRKVARIVGTAQMACEARSLPISGQVIAARVRALVDAGALEGVGNLRRWRYSEVRLKAD